MAASLQAFQNRLSPSVNASQEAPIFIFANTWRSGSTYLQRLIMDASDTVLWGEPYDRALFVDRLSHSVRFFEAAWPTDDSFVEAKPGFAKAGTKGLSGDWIANLYPPGEAVRKAHQAFFLELLKVPAERLGATRWGFKDVRLSMDHAIYLQWLFPRAKFLFLYRNPYDAYLSYRGTKSSWYRAFPDDRLFSGTKFGQHWRSLLQGFMNGHQHVAGLMVCYETLCSDESLRRSVFEYLGIPPSQSQPLEKLRGAGAWMPPDGEFLRNEISSVELWSLRRQVEPLASVLGYRGPSVG